MFFIPPLVFFFSCFVHFHRIDDLNAWAKCVDFCAECININHSTHGKAPGRALQFQHHHNHYHHHYHPSVKWKSLCTFSRFFSFVYNIHIFSLHTINALHCKSLLLARSEHKYRKCVPLLQLVQFASNWEAGSSPIIYNIQHIRNENKCL